MAASPLEEGLDETHDPTRRSWVVSANGHREFPIQNLPLGVFSTSDDPRPRAGVAIGDAILDLAAAAAARLFSSGAQLPSTALAEPHLNTLMNAGAPARVALRRRLVDVLTEGARERQQLEPLLHAGDRCTMHLPCAVGDYTDFYAGIHHAVNVGRQFRPDHPLLPNYKYVPIGYHGRASSLVASGMAVRRPYGQRRMAGDDSAPPVFGPSRRLDYELELGVWIGPGNDMGVPIPIDAAPDHIAGFCLLNDWSARDIQAWEYQPLGPFLAKSFATSVSPWVITPEALAPFRVPQLPRPDGDPAPLAYLASEHDSLRGAFEIELEVLLMTPCLQARNLPAHRLSLGSTRDMYWTVAQLVTHHTSNGCNLRPGDLLGSGTISAPTADGFGSLLEITEGGRQAVTLASGSTRTFLEDGDEIVMRARARRDGFASIGFGDVRGTILPALSAGQ